ncbi:hypothetical protein [Bradyrhizobium algeriense]|uniref:hypothetical protein n=1 Tax=Bradyrhizobium algeriense TaxID=634784 RepID=UPI000D3331ED|nr:hypothetical protein [Bradyrhizobium algeriense]
MPDNRPDYPDRFGPALRGLLTTGLLTPFAIKATENIADGHYFPGGVYAALAIVILLVGVYWAKLEILSARIGVAVTSSAAPVVLSMLTTVVLASVYFFGASVGRGQTVSPTPIGNVVWNLEQTARSAGWFLSMNKVGNGEVRVTGFSAHGRNTSSQPIKHFSGYMRSDLTNAQIPIFVLGQDQDEEKLKVCFSHSWIPTLPQETYGIPGYADFDIVTFENAVTLPGADGVPLAKFMNDFVPFTIFLEYDGTKYERQFTKAEVDKQVETFVRSINPQSTPRVLRRPSAKPPVLPTLQTLLPPNLPKPGLSSPIPSVGLPKLPTN